uniref:Uncharacterized protein n=1 Tax=Arundo donax TaxID=35708 RepID=A0A0A9ECA1_ARUDO
MVPHYVVVNSGMIRGLQMTTLHCYSHNRHGLAIADVPNGMKCESSS